MASAAAPSIEARRSTATSVSAALPRPLGPSGQGGSSVRSRSRARSASACSLREGLSRYDSSSMSVPTRDVSAPDGRQQVQQRLAVVRDHLEPRPVQHAPQRGEHRQARRAATSMYAHTPVAAASPSPSSGAEWGDPS